MPRQVFAPHTLHCHQWLKLAGAVLWWLMGGQLLSNDVCGTLVAFCPLRSVDKCGSRVWHGPSGQWWRRRRKIEHEKCPALCCRVWICYLLYQKTLSEMLRRDLRPLSDAAFNSLGLASLCGPDFSPLCLQKSQKSFLLCKIMSLYIKVALFIFFCGIKIIWSNPCCLCYNRPVLTDVLCLL